MPTVKLAPGPFGAGYQAFDNNGRPLNGGLINTYAAGTSTPSSTYTTSAGTVANSNPIVLDSSGRTPAEIWLVTGQAYKFVLTDSASNILGTWDNLVGINDSQADTASQWIDYGAPTFISATSFSVPGDQTAIFHVGRRVKSTNTGGTIYGTIQSSVFTTLTTVVVSNDSGVIDSGISDVQYSLLTASNSAIPYLGFLPSGCMIDGAFTAALTGWKLCDGSNISRTAFASLFAAIGTTWGVGDGSTTFTLPDARRKTAVGSGGSGTGTLGNAVGNTGGEEAHALTLGENGTHSHTLSSATVSSSFTGTPLTMKLGGGAGSNNEVAQGSGTNAAQTLTPSGSIASSLDALTLNNSGSGTAHNTIQPSYVCLKMIKV